jgi:ubiquitin carboxyl-terminal hydrolase 4/11/15
MIANSIPQFNNSNGQDAHEMLNYLLDMIHEDTNTAAIQAGHPKYYEALLSKMPNESDISAAKRFWNHYKERNSSIIVDYFTGQLKNTIECAVCDNVSVTFQPFVTLPVPIPIMRAVDVFIVPSINIKSTIKLTIFVSETALFIDLRNYLRKYIRSDIKVERFRSLLVNSKSQTAKFARNSDNIYQTSRKGHIFVYEVDERFPEDEDYYPLIALVRLKQEESQNNISSSSFSYPRMFPVAPLDTLKTLRANIYGCLRKYYSPQESFSLNYAKISSNYREGKFLDEFEYEKVIMEEYKNLFCDPKNSESQLNEEYLLNYPFKVSLISSKDETNKSKVLFSSQREEFTSTLQENSKIEKLIELIKSGYKIVIEITKPSKDLENKMNSMLNIKDQENKNYKTPSIYDCLDHFSLYEKLEKGNEFYCERCRKLQNAFRKLEIFYVPKNFVIVFKRYEVKRLTKFSIQILKNNTFVTYPINGLDLMKYVTAKEPRAVYDLYAVSQHSGSTEGGHYATACRNFGKWYEIDDISIFPSEEEMTVSREGYILLYRRNEKNK